MASDETEARGAADHLALALEDAGFDVGHDFPGLHDTIGRGGVEVVSLGDVRPVVASRLADVVIRGAPKR